MAKTGRGASWGFIGAVVKLGVTEVGERVMLQIAVYGNSKWSQIMKTLVEGEYSDLVTAQGGCAISVAAFVVLEKPDNNGEISVEEFGRLYREGVLSAIVIPKEYYIQQNELVYALLREGVDLEDVYDGMRLGNLQACKERIAYLLTPILSDSYLPYLEFHVADHCNLNCKYCTHYAPLVTKPVFTEYEGLKKDIRQLKSLIDDIGVIRILGGEPLLNPELGRYIRLVRSLYPASIITVVTNGLLVTGMTQELIRDMKENLAFIHISYYPPMEKQIQKVQEFLYENGIPYTITAKITEFQKTQTLQENPDEDFFYRCFQATCTCLHEGKLAPCYAPFTTKYFNAAFGEKLPVNEGTDLYEEGLTAPVLKARLLIPMERCRYCVEGKAYPWEIVGKQSSLEDWVEEME